MTEDLNTQQKLNPRQLAVVTRKNEIQQQEAELKKMLPPSIPSDKFIRTVQTAITLNPDLAEADKNSVLTSCMKAASDGLVLDGREAALTIYNTKVKRNGQETWVKMAQYIPMVAGIIKRVRNSGEVSRLNAFVVYENDLFEVEFGLEMSLRHKPNFADPGKPIGAYAVCKFKDGEIDFEFMSLKQIEGIRERSKSKDKGPWQTDWSEMARKTVLRRLSKRLPVDSDIARVVERIDEDYDFKPNDSAETPDPDVVIDNETGEVKEKPPAKTRGAAASKLNPKPKAAEPEPPVIDHEPAESESDSNSSAGETDEELVEDII
jgi:recombination protein RecT